MFGGSIPVPVAYSIGWFVSAASSSKELTLQKAVGCENLSLQPPLAGSRFPFANLLFGYPF